MNDAVDMKHFTINIAGLNIGISSISPRAYCHCIKYITVAEPELYISIDERDVQREIEDGKKLNVPINEAYLESLAVYRKIVEALLDYDILLIHGAAIAINEISFLFSAASGVGKTTHIKKWLKNSKEVYIVNGDKPLIRLTDSEAIVCGTPWRGKEEMGTNTMVPLKSIIMMERAENNHIRQITFEDAFPNLFQQVYRPIEEAKMRKTLMLLQRLSTAVSFWHFQCNNFKDDCFEVAYNALVERGS